MLTPSVKHYLLSLLQTWKKKMVVLKRRRLAGGTFGLQGYEAPMKYGIIGASYLGAAGGPAH